MTQELNAFVNDNEQIIVDGNTYIYRQQLRSLNFRWNPEEKNWFTKFRHFYQDEYNWDKKLRYLIKVVCEAIAKHEEDNFDELEWAKKQLEIAHNSSYHKCTEITCGQFKEIIEKYN